MVYGHRSKTDCNDIELMIPVGAVDPAQITSAVNGLNPKGKTPLSESLRQASAALGAKDATVILVSDGIETCKGDPCAVAAELKKSNVRFTAHVIGFNVADPVTKTQLQCIARNTGGVYLDASNASSLENALGKAVDAAQGAKVASEAPAKAPTADPYKDKNWRAVARLAEGLDPIADGFLVWLLHKPAPGGEKGDYVQTENGARVMASAEPGKYIMTVTYGETEREFPITITKEPSTQDVILNAGYVTSEGALAGTGAKADKVTWEVRTAGDEYVATNYDAVPRFVLPAGDYVMVLSKGNADVKKPFSLAAGDTINLAIDDARRDSASGRCGLCRERPPRWRKISPSRSAGPLSARARKASGSRPITIRSRNSTFPPGLMISLSRSAPRSGRSASKSAPAIPRA